VISAMFLMIYVAGMRSDSDRLVRIIWSFLFVCAVCFVALVFNG